jgi:hypothetical protein
MNVEVLKQVVDAHLAYVEAEGAKATAIARKRRDRALAALSVQDRGCLAGLGAGLLSLSAP